MTLKEFFKWLLNTTEPELTTVTRTEIPDGAEARRQAQEILDKALAKEKADILVTSRLLETYFNLKILEAIKRHDFSISSNIDDLTSKYGVYTKRALEEVIPAIYKQKNYSTNIQRAYGYNSGSGYFVISWLASVK